MQIDFHHAVTYVLARLAGFAHQEAATIACAAQYVDDATNKGTIRFDNGMKYDHIASSHTVFDVGNNCVNEEDYRVWVPFHFLPGNNGADKDEAPMVPMIQRLLCMPDSPVAADMCAACLVTRGQANSLHRLGITTHVYADTWAHKFFAGIRHRINYACDISGVGIMEELQSCVAAVLELGHGAVLTCPDLPSLDWKYSDASGEEVWRSNPIEFMVAAERIFSLYTYYRGEGGLERAMLAEDRRVLDHGLRSFTDRDGCVRHQQWRALIAEGAFSFGPLTELESTDLDYRAKGTGSWKHKALRTTNEKDSADEVFHYDASFENSDWKRFHDALKDHQSEVLTRILPRFGITAASIASALRDEKKPS